MAADTHDQGTPSALRPRRGWDKAARNPVVNHSLQDLTAVPSSGYAGASYQPIRGSLLSDAGDIDQSLYKELQQVRHRITGICFHTPSRSAHLCPVVKHSNCHHHYKICIPSSFAEHYYNSIPTHH